MKLLVTGGCGFLGSNVVADALRRGVEVTVLDNLSRVEVAVVNVGSIQAWIDAGRLKGDAPLTVNADVLSAAGLLKTRGKPLKVLGQGEVSVPLFVVADAFSRTAILSLILLCGAE